MPHVYNRILLSYTKDEMVPLAATLTDPDMIIPSDHTKTNGIRDHLDLESRK